MIDLRAPDPTLTELDPDEWVVIDGAGPSVAHRFPASGEDGCVSRESVDSYEVEARFARWEAVPCRECFPDAPPPGTDPLNRPKAGMYLAWQTRGGG